MLLVGQLRPRWQRCGGRTSWLGNGDLMGGDNGASLDELIVALKAQQTELFVALVGED